MEIDPKDLIVDSYPAYRGGMLVGTAKGVKITHKPTGIIVTETGERSQHRNKAKAFETLTKCVEAYYNEKGQAMNNWSTGEQPKAELTLEAQFWQEVYVAAIRAGKSAYEANCTAEVALGHMRKEFKSP